MKRAMLDLLSLEKFEYVLALVFLIAFIEALLYELQSDTLGGRFAIRFLFIVSGIITTMLILIVVRKIKSQSPLQKTKQP